MYSSNLSNSDYLTAFDQETGEIKRLNFADEKGRVVEQYEPSESVIRKYQMLSAAREMLPNKLELAGSNRVLKPRVKFCLRQICSTASPNKGEDVAIWKSKEHKTAFYKNLTVCGSVHSCPVCRAKIAARRSEELKLYIDQHKAQGGQVLMLTFTFSHHRETDFHSIVRGLKRSYSGFKELRAVKEVRKLTGEFEYGSCSAFEATHSFKNGWHPHLHCLWFVRDGVNIKQMHKMLAKRWCDYAEKKGLGRPEESVGLDIRDADDVAAQYISKVGADWTAAKEMTHLASKKAKGSSRNPWQLIADYIDHGDQAAKMLFIEYVAATHGIHFVDVTNKLKKNYGEEVEKTDEELAQESVDDADLLGYLSREQWQIVLNNSSTKYDARAIVLLIAQNDFIGVDLYISGLPNNKKKSKSKYYGHSQPT